MKCPVEYDLAKYLREQEDYDLWFEQNETDLEELFFIKYGFSPVEDDGLWERFVNREWEKQ